MCSVAPNNTWRKSRSEVGHFSFTFLDFKTCLRFQPATLPLITGLQPSHPNWSTALCRSWVFHRGSWIFLVACGLGRKGLLLCRGLWASRALDNWPELINPCELFHSSRTFHWCRNESGQHSKLPQDWRVQIHTPINLYTHACSRARLLIIIIIWSFQLERSENMKWEASVCDNQYF